MRFRELAWAGFCFYYRSAGDRRYASVMKDRQFLTRLRNDPGEVSLREFEQKAILGYINIQNYDLLVGYKLAENLLHKIKGLKKETAFIQGMKLEDCNLADSLVADAIERIYSGLQVDGLWITGASKIAHLLNEQLLPPVNVDITRHFGIQWKSGLMLWMKKMQADVEEALDDFARMKTCADPAEYLSKNLGYSTEPDGFVKSMVRFADEYYWLRYGDGLAVPPAWTPECMEIQIQRLDGRARPSKKVKTGS